MKMAEHKARKNLNQREKNTPQSFLGRSFSEACYLQLNAILNGLRLLLMGWVSWREGDPCRNY